VTLKTGLGLVQGHWKWHHLIDRLYEFLFAFHSNYGDILYRLRDIATLLVQNREMFTPPPVFSAAACGDPSEFREYV